MSMLTSAPIAAPLAPPASQRQVRSPLALAWWKLRRDRAAMFGGAMVLLLALACLLAPLIAPDDPYVMDSAIRLAPPGAAGHVLGTDFSGRDMLSRLLWGGQVSLLVGFIPVLLSAAIGIPLGMLAGYFGGSFDHVVMRVLDMVMAFPAVLLAIALVATLGPGLNNAILALMVVSVPSFARIVRASALSIREREFVTAGVALGGTTPWILGRHILPNLMSSVTVYATLEAARMILFAAGLSFLGLGAQAPQPEWGAMLAEGRNVIQVAPHVTTLPGVAIFVVTMGLNLLGDGLRDALDPRLRA
jgi:peptide/nickel transport system permease protein